MNSKERLKKVFVEALELPADLEVETLEYRKCAQWDSVGHMRMIAALEMEFDVLLETDQILDLSSFTKGLEILQAHGVAG
ncbi:MAG: acyl carrier protein [Alphaproteobacteria bacterium]|nr:acyl carrier protein [Alphaproteobacteria bacterium]